MNAGTFTNPDLLEYWNTIHDSSLTRLNIQQVLSIGTHIKCIEVFPTKLDAIRWSDGLTTVQLGGNQYTPYPDLISDSFPSFTEEKDITNTSVNFKVSNVNTSSRMLALGGAFKDAKVNMYLVILNPANGQVLDYDLMYSGFIDYVECETDPVNPVNEMTVYLNSVYKKLDLQTRTLAAHSVYSGYYPGDNIMSLLGITNNGQSWTYKK